MTDWLNIIKDVGLPIALVIYFIVRFDKQISRILQLLEVWAKVMAEKFDQIDKKYENISEKMESIKDQNNEISSQIKVVEVRIQKND
jgi:septal ring factor EnvC (AmiA/AmiB activator)